MLKKAKILKKAKMLKNSIPRMPRMSCAAIAHCAIAMEQIRNASARKKELIVSSFMMTLVMNHL